MYLKKMFQPGKTVNYRNNANKFFLKKKEYLNVFLLMWAHRVNWCFMPLKSVQLITTDSFPYLHGIGLLQM
jgi:hypothetical protein